MDAATADPVALVDALEPEVIRERIADLDRQARALRVLLRAAVARERTTRHSAPNESSMAEGGPTHAA